MNNYQQSAYNLSKRYSPPKIDLRQAEMLDSLGEDTYATRPIHHQVPEDVTKEDLDFYNFVFSYMELSDLLFYLYPVALEFEYDKCLDCIDSLFYTLEDELPKHVDSLSEDDLQGIKDALMWIWESHKLGYVDWIQCPYLQSLIDKSATMDDLYIQHYQK